MDDNARELYEANEMRKAEKSDPNNKSQIMVEAGAEKLHYLEMQSKTPAAPPLTVFLYYNTTLECTLILTTPVKRILTYEFHHQMTVAC